MSIMRDKLNVLITGAGSAMAQSVFKALLLSKFKDDVNVIFTNSEALGAGFFMNSKVKKCYMVPIAKDPNYIPKMLELCKNENIDILFSGTEHEIFQLSKNKSHFKNECGTLVMLSDYKVIELGTDKLKTAVFFKKNKLPFPDTVLFDDHKKLISKYGYPIFMKPRIASASRNIYKINNEKELFEKKFDDSSKIILQNYLDSDIEYTVECFMDKDGNISGTIPMKRNLDYGLSVSGMIDKNNDVINVCEMITRKIKPQGPINIQLRIVNGKPIPFEINTRFSSTECIRAKYGFNSVEAAIMNYYYNQPINLKKYTSGLFIRYWEECYLSQDDYNKLIKTGKLIR